MEIRIFIVSLACLSCLVPPAVGTLLMAKAALAGVKGVKVGLAAKGAVGLIAKKALLGILLKAAAIKGAALLGKKNLAMKGAGVQGLKVLTSILTAEETDSSVTERSDSDAPTTTTVSPLRELFAGSARMLQAAVRLSRAKAQKSRAIYRLMSALPRMLPPGLMQDLDDK